VALTLGPRLRAFLDEVFPAVVGTARHDGTVAMTPLWFEYADGLVLLNGGPNRAWFRRMRRTGTTSLLLLDPRNMFRFARIEGRLAEATTEGADEHIERLSRRYTGGPYAGPKVDRLIIKVEPTAVSGGEMRQPWDVEASG
jgi:PPOX class probable F420-dependent enzyme